MTAQEQSIGRAAAVRDAAAARIRKTTAAVVALAAGLTAVFTGVAASSTHAKQHVAGAPQAAPAQQQVRAPVPSLVPVGRRRDRAAPAPAPSQSSTPATAPAPSPAPVTAPPVVSSGGS
jgi:hypothetical protein